MQALCIYISVLQHSNEQMLAATMSGVLVKLALSLKLHTCTTDDLRSLDTLELETRRRLWWRVCIIDARSAGPQTFNFQISENNFKTSFPSNVNDTDLSATAATLPNNSGEWTDSTPLQVRCEIWRSSRTLLSLSNHSSEPNFWKRREAFRQCQAKLEGHYISRSSCKDPLHLFTVASTRLFLAKTGLILLAEQNKISTGNAHQKRITFEDEIFKASLSIILYTHLIQSETSWRGWRWLVQCGKPSWEALSTVLNYLRTQDWQSPQASVWAIAKTYFDCIPEAHRGEDRYRNLSCMIKELLKKAETPIDPRAPLCLPQEYVYVTQQDGLNPQPAPDITKVGGSYVDPKLTSTFFQDTSLLGGDDHADLSVEEETWLNWEQQFGQIDYL